MKSNFEDLKILLESDEWPEAVSNFLICNETEEDKEDRARGILNLLSIDLKGKKFLDFGCGEGHLVIEASKYCDFSIGFDVTQTGNLNWNENLTTDWEKVKSNGPFDVIVLFDVIEHCEYPFKVLKQVKEVCHPDTYVFCRFHPWMSPHAGHYYKQINKAYIHLIFTDDELRKLGLTPTFSHKFWKPIDQIASLLKSTGFEIINYEIHRTRVSSFFNDNEIVRNRLPLNHFNDQFPEWQMSQEFHDYIIKSI